MRCSIFLAITVALIIVAGTAALHADVSLEPFTYTEDFESQELNAWAAYPHWQDTAYNPQFRVNTIVPGDPNISIEQIVTPYTNVDNYAGAQKLLDMYLTPESSITLRYYLKTDLKAEFFKVRLAAGSDGKVDATISNPPTGRWVWLTVDYNDFVRQNPGISGKGSIKVNVLAVLAKIPDADPAMPIYLGLDDVTFEGARACAFQFAEPMMHKLSEWKPYIPEKHYRKGQTLTLRGRWPLDADKVAVSIASFTDPASIVHTGNLKKSGGEWKSDIKLSWPDGLYLATLTALDGKEMLSDTQFTIFVANPETGGVHPRVWFNSEEKQEIKEKLDTDKFKSVGESFVKAAKNHRENNPVEKVIFDYDQFPDETWLFYDRHRPWFSRISVLRSGVYNNALAYGLYGDIEAGEYARDLMLKASGFPYWLHPWFFKRGRNIYYPIGELGMEWSIAYDLMYDFLSENERKTIRGALMKNIVLGCHKGYVEDNLCTNNTSNWVAHITGGSLMCLAAFYGDGDDVADLEPYLTGAIFKNYDLVQKSIDKDGAYGEGYGYFSFTMLSWGMTFPAFDNVFNIDMSQNVKGAYKELIWAGYVKNKRYFSFGDSGGGLGALPRFAYLVPKHKDPLFGWFYNFLKGGETFNDVLYDTKNVPKDDPFDENPVKLFRGTGTSVFKSGWEKDDFVFVLRTGSFYNHQHIDQGSFYIADKGTILIDERHGSTYYNDPLYQPWYTQPVAHSTILIDHNHQSQRVGDTLEFAEGFHDHAFVDHFLDGEKAAFTCGDIGKLYWGKVKCLRRNVLYLKPRTILMLDTAVPGDRDVDVSLLYQAGYMENIQAGKDISTITKDNQLLHIVHIAPENREIDTVKTPHYLGSLRSSNPLKQEGMLTVTARTDHTPLVMANLLSTEGIQPDVTHDRGEGFVSGTANGIPFVFTTRLKSLYSTGGITTDALAFTRSGGSIFAAMCTVFEHNATLLVQSDESITCEINSSGIRYYLSQPSLVALGVESKPSRITVNGSETSEFRYDGDRKAVVLELPAGEGNVKFK
ncbi:heparinase II/III family protein [Candidatus Omnitrophota bacterium]